MRKAEKLDEKAGMKTMGLIACSLRGVPVYSYGLFVAAALLLGLLVAWLCVKAQKVSFAPVLDMALWGIPLALLGGRAGFVFHHFDRYSSHLPDIFAVWQGGFSLYGMIAGVLAAVIGTCRVQGRDTWIWLDRLIPSGVIFLAVLEMGVFILQLNPGLPFPDDIPNDHALAEYIEYNYRPIGFGDTLYFQPIALYQPGLQLLIFFLLLVLTLLRAKRHWLRTPGSLFLLGTAGVAWIRLGCGFFYLATGADDGAAMPLGRILSGGIGLFAIFLLMMRRRSDVWEKGMGGKEHVGNVCWKETEGLAETGASAPHAGAHPSAGIQSQAADGYDGRRQ